MRTLSKGRGLESESERKLTCTLPELFEPAFRLHLVVQHIYGNITLLQERPPRLMDDSARELAAGIRAHVFLPFMQIFADLRFNRTEKLQWFAAICTDDFHDVLIDRRSDYEQK